MGEVYLEGKSEVLMFDSPARHGPAGPDFWEMISTFSLQI